MNYVSQNKPTQIGKHEIDELILIENVEWRVSEIIDGKYTLYREGVGGSSHTLELAQEELDKKIAEN